MRSCYVYVDCCTLRHKPHENVAWLANSAAVPYSSILTMSYPGEIRKTCMLKVLYGTMSARARVLAIFHTTFWPMSNGKDSKPELELKDIGRFMKIRDRQSMLQGGTCKKYSLLATSA